jgi:trigger factor
MFQYTNISMKVEIENLEGHKKKIIIEIPADHVDQHFEGYYKDVQKSVELKGFRKGKAPMPLVKQLYRDSAAPRIMQSIVEDHLWAAMRDHSLNPITMPQVDADVLKENLPFKFSATFENTPPVEIKDYKSKKVQEKPIEVTDQEIEKTIENIRSQLAVLKDLPEGTEAELGQVVVLDFEATEAGAPVPEATEKDAQLELGNKTLTPEFEQNVLGMKKGETKSFTVKFPNPEKDEDRTPVSGRTLDFSVNLKSLQSKILPELNDEFAKRLGPFESFAKLKERIVADIKSEKTNRIRSELTEEMAAWLLEKNPVEAPEVLVSQQLEQLAMDSGMQLGQMGLDQTAIEARLKEWAPSMEEKAKKQVRLSLLLSAIAKTESIKATEDDLRQEITRIAMQTKRAPKDVLEDFQKRGVIAGLARQVTEMKTLKWIVDEALKA